MDTYNYSNHIAWDILQLTAKPMDHEMSGKVLQFIMASGFDKDEIKTACHIVEHLSDNWNREEGAKNAKN